MPRKATGQVIEPKEGRVMGHPIPGARRGGDSSPLGLPPRVGTVIGPRPSSGTFSQTLRGYLAAQRARSGRGPR